MALNSTTLGAAVGSNDSTVVLASTTNITSIGLWLFTDAEAMRVIALPNAGGVVRVQRGVGPTRVLPHVTGLTVYIGTADQFYLQDPEGTPPTWPAVTPWINLVTGAIWDVSGSAWVITGGGTGTSTGTGARVLQTSPTITSPTLTTPALGAATFTSFTASATAATLQSSTTTAHTLLIKAYDVDGTAYATFATFTNGNTPTGVISAPSGGTLTLQPTTYKSSDGTSGATAGPFTTITAITVKDGLVTALTGS